MQLGKPPSVGGPFVYDDNPNGFPGLRDDRNVLVVTQIQWSF